MSHLQTIDASRYKNIVFLTGAGVSAASGLPTFRGPNGIWQGDVAYVTNAANLPGSLPQLWEFYGRRRAAVQAVQSNPAHTVIADFQRKWHGSGRSVSLFTQNVDGLHQRGGSPDVVELHSSIFRTRCLNPACALEPYPDETVPDEIPTCPLCGWALRPDVVLFGELLPAEATWRAQRALRGCDLFIAVGTSGTVSPAADYVRRAGLAGARTIYVNLTSMTPRNTAFKEEYLGPAEEILPVLLGG